MRARPAQKRPDDSKSPAGRFTRIKDTLLSQPVRLCTERALLITEFFKRHDDPTESMMVRKAKALSYLLRKKSVKIFDDELIVGNVGSHRKSVIIQPELSGVVMSEELLWMNRRKTNPYPVSWKERLELLFKVIPYWYFRNMNSRAFKWYSPKLVPFCMGAA